LLLILLIKPALNFSLFPDNTPYKTTFIPANIRNTAQRLIVLIKSIQKITIKAINEISVTKRLLPIRKHREERENGIASAVPFSHFSIDAVTFDISKAPMPL